MSDDDLFKLPRLYVEGPLMNEGGVPLSPEQAHYFRNVLRRNDGDQVRVFNGQDGEWLGQLSNLGKKGGQVVLERQTKTQPEKIRPVHLYFAPIKKSRMDWLVEKAIELGATDLHPVVTQNTEVRDINAGRLHTQMMEAAEQCERLDRPALHDIIKLDQIPESVAAGTKFLAALERGDTVPMNNAIDTASPVAVLIGPEGGFTGEEAAWIAKQKDWACVSLGPRILRCETAVCVALTAVLIKGV